MKFQKKSLKLLLAFCHLITPLSPDCTPPTNTCRCVHVRVAYASILHTHTHTHTHTHGQLVLQIWCSFSSRSEEEQLQLTSRLGNTHHRHQQPDKHDNAAQQEIFAPPTPTPEQSFRRIEQHIRAILRHNKCLPTVSMYLMHTLLS